MVSWRRTATFVAALTLALTACGGGGGSGTAGGSKSTEDGNGSTVQPKTAAGLHDAETAEVTAAFARDAKTSYGLLSKACRQKYSQSEWATQLARGTALVEAFTKVKYKDLKVQKVETRNVAGTSGEARAFIGTTTDGAPLDMTPPWDKWLYEDGGWRLNDCKDVGGVE
jgi:hypothetical protein